MPFINVPVFVPRQIVTAAELNQISSALQSFAATGADITWPLQADGNLDMNGNDIVGLQSFWTIINAREYAASELQDAIDAASSGAIVFFDAGDEFEHTGLTITDDNVWLIGCGAETVLKLSSGGAGPLVKIGPAVSNVVISNMTLDGVAGAAGSDGVEAQQVTGLRLDSVIFNGFTGEPIRLVNNGTAGNACVDCVITNCTDVLSTGIGILANDVDGLVIDKYLSQSPGSDGINMEADGPASLMRDIQITNCRIEEPTGKGIYIASDSGAADDKWARVSISNTKVVSPDGDGIQVGDTSKIIRSVNITDCEVEGVVGADGFKVNAQKGKISGCIANDATADGLDILDSEDLYVNGCLFRDAGVIGIDTSSTTVDADCTIMGNNVQGSAVGIAKPTGIVSGNVYGNNVGDTAKLIGGTLTGSAAANNIGGATEVEPFVWTIPANTLQAGDHVRVTCRGEAANESMNMRVRLGTDVMGLAEIAAADNAALVAEFFVDSNGPDTAGGNNVRGFYYSINTLGGTTEAGEQLVGHVAYTIDLTVDQDLKVTGSNASPPAPDDATLNYAIVNFFQGEII